MPSDQEYSDEDTVREAESAIPAEQDCEETIVPKGDISVRDGFSSDDTALLGNRYRYIRPHATGGLGTVFLAYDRDLNRDVAIKEIHPRFRDDLQVQALFLREAQITGALQHPGVVPVYSLNRTDEGRPFYAMRFIEGATLKDAIISFHGKDVKSFSQRSIGFRRLLGHFISACQTMEYVHERGVIHRDLKPSNIMIGEFGETMVVDWGLAKYLSETSTEPLAALSTRSADEELMSAFSLSGSTVGTPAYMSPEQAAGESSRIGPLSDIFSLAATLYEILTCRRPFDESSIASTLEKVRAGEFPPPRALDPEIPETLEKICLKGMAFDPADRYESCQKLATDIELWLADEPVKGVEENWKVRLDRALTRSGFESEFESWPPALLAIALVVLIANSLVFWFSQGPPPYHYNTNIRTVQVLVILGILMWSGAFRQRPRSEKERFLWSIWLAYLFAWSFAYLGMKDLNPGPSWNDLKFYSVWCPLTGLVFIAMGPLYFGRCYIFGMAFFVLGFFTPDLLQYTPLLFGLLFAGCLIWIRSQILKEAT